MSPSARGRCVHLDLALWHASVNAPFGDSRRGKKSGKGWGPPSQPEGQEGTVSRAFVAAGQDLDLQPPGYGTYVARLDNGGYGLVRSPQITLDPLRLGQSGK